MDDLMQTLVNDFIELKTYAVAHWKVLLITFLTTTLGGTFGAAIQNMIEDENIIYCSYKGCAGGMAASVFAVVGVVLIQTS